MSPPVIDKTVEHIAGDANSASWLEKNVCHPGWEALITGLYEPTANFLNLLPHAVTGKDWLPKVKVDTTHDEAPADSGEYLSRLLVHGAVGALSYTAYGRLAGGLLRKSTSLTKLEGRAASFFGSETSGQIAGAAIHDALLEAPDLRSRTANVAGSVASFGVFEYLNKSIHHQHWTTKAIAHAPIGFAGGMTGYIAKEGVAGRQLDGQVGFQSALDGAALNVFLPAMQWTSGKALDMVADKSWHSIPLDSSAPKLRSADTVLKEWFQENQKEYRKVRRQIEDGENLAFYNLKGVHDVDFYRRACKQQKLKAIKPLGFGDEAMVLEIEGDRALKLHMKPLQDEFGTRPFDIPILEKGSIRTPDGQTLYYHIQPKAELLNHNFEHWTYDRLKEADVIVEAFDESIKPYGYYLQDEGPHQLGRYNGKVVLLDYAAAWPLSKRPPRLWERLDFDDSLTP